MDILKLVLDFIKSRHPEAAASISDYSAFIEQPGDKHNYGYTNTVLSGYNWSIKIGHAVTPQPVYSVTANYKNGEIVWNGQIINGLVKETNYEENLL
jgi:hypothetical protein